MDHGTRCKLTSRLPVPDRSWTIVRFPDHTVDPGTVHAATGIQDGVGGVTSTRLRAGPGSAAAR